MLLTREIKGSIAQTALFHPLAMEESVVRPPDEFLQLRPRCIDDLCARFAQNTCLYPKLSPHRSRHHQHTAKAKNTSHRENDFLLSTRHYI